MVRTFPFIYHINQPNVGTYIIHGSSKIFKLNKNTKLSTFCKWIICLAIGKSFKHIILNRDVMVMKPMVRDKSKTTLTESQKKTIHLWKTLDTCAFVAASL